ncbi:MAG: hypothetical protein CL608_22780 [Anaerolineaceae bacterium]|nr:hypothetical protein [Anaerolineaceae bacterium]
MSSVVDTAVTLNLWPHILTAHSHIGQALPPSTRQAMMTLVDAHVAEPWHLFHFIYVVENFDSTSLSTANYQKRDPFDRPSEVDAFWQACLTTGFLQANSHGMMQITDKGETVRQQRWQILNDALAEQVLLPGAELAQLNELLTRVVDETAVTTTKASAWAFHTRRQQGLKSPLSPLAPLAQFIELRMDLGAFRDDAHLASWRGPHVVSPHAWEILGEIWQNETATLDELVAKLARRGFSAGETAVALEELFSLGWLRQAQKNYHLTEDGRAVRQTAEQTTNDIFYAPWSVLSPAELEVVRTGLGAFQTMS